MLKFFLLLNLLVSLDIYALSEAEIKSVEAAIKQINPMIQSMISESSNKAEIYTNLLNNVQRFGGLPQVVSEYQAGVNANIMPYNVMKLHKGGVTVAEVLEYRTVKPQVDLNQVIAYKQMGKTMPEIKQLIGENGQVQLYQNSAALNAGIQMNNPAQQSTQGGGGNVPVGVQSQNPPPPMLPPAIVKEAAQRVAAQQAAARAAADQEDAERAALEYVQQQEAAQKLAQQQGTQQLIAPPMDAQKKPAPSVGTQLKFKGSGAGLTQEKLLNLNVMETVLQAGKQAAQPATQKSASPPAPVKGRQSCVGMSGLARQKCIDGVKANQQQVINAPAKKIK